MDKKREREVEDRLFGGTTGPLREQQQAKLDEKVNTEADQLLAAMLANGSLGKFYRLMPDVDAASTALAFIQLMGFVNGWEPEETAAKVAVLIAPEIDIPLGKAEELIRKLVES